MRVLVIEENPVSQMITVAMLRALGLKAHKASNMAIARQWLAENECDAIMIDSRVSEGDSVGFIREQRTEGGGPPVIALAALSNHAYQEKCLQAGATCCLEKPFTLKQLDGVLRKHFPAYNAR